MVQQMTMLGDDIMAARNEGYSLSWLEQLSDRQDRSDIEMESLPELSHNLTGRLHGAIPRPGLPQVGAYVFRTKQEVWGYNLRKLFEEAISRQWSSATDVPWHTLEALPDDIERAECQLATFFTEVEFVAADVPGRFIASMSPDYDETRQFLLTQVMDESRHMDVFRKRALANGGGLMRRVDTTTGVVGGRTDDARDFTEMSSRLHILGEGGVLTLFRLGELMAYNDAEKTIYRRAAQDEARHVAFGILHLKYLGETCPERREEVHAYLDEGEVRQATGAGGENPAGSNALTSEALAILLGGGKNKVDEGYNILRAIRKRQAKEYFQRLKSCGFDDRIHNGRVNAALLAAVKDS
jgi:hypothetical protein